MTRIVAVNDRGYRIGQSHHNARLTDAEVEIIRKLHLDEKMTYQQIAEKFEISRHTVLDICLFRRRADTPARWKMVEV